MAVAALAIVMVVPGAVGVATAAPDSNATDTAGPQPSSNITASEIPPPPSPSNLTAGTAPTPSRPQSASPSLWEYAALAEDTRNGLDVELTYRLLPEKPHAVEVQIDYRVGDDVAAIVLYPPDDTTVVDSKVLERQETGNFYATDDLTGRP